MRQALVVVTRSPMPGSLENRLLPPLNPQSALDLYASLLRDTLALAASLERTDVTLLYPGGRSGTAQLLRALTPPSFRLLRQRGRGLVAALTHACRVHFGLGYHKVLLTSPGTPTLPRHYLEEAFRRLNVHDVVVGPSLDGRYYLVAVRAFHPGLFVGLGPYDERIASQVVERARELDLTVSLLPFWYRFDGAGGIDRLRQEVGGRRDGHALHTSALLSLWEAEGMSELG